MKINYYIKLILLSLSLWLNACGQEGPLYLPTNTPPIAIPPNAKKQLDEKKQRDNKKPATIEKSQETPPNLIKEIH